MKKIASLLFFISIFRYAQVGIGTTTPNGALEINSDTNGIIVPNVLLTSRLTSAPVVNPNGGGIPLNGTLVWNTATAGSSPNNVVPGFYFWDTNVWVALAGDGGKNWTTNGNGGTTAGTNFIGTTDVADFRFRTGGLDRLNISNSNNGQLQTYSSGSAALPVYSFQSNTNTGLFSSSANNVDFSTNGIARFRIPNADQVHALSLGTAALPFYSFNGQTTTGIFGVATNTLAFSTAGSQRMTISNTGNVGIGTTTPGFALDAASAGRTINATTSAGTSAAIFGFNIGAAGTGGGGYGIAGQTNQSGSAGVRGEQLNAGGDAISGINFGASGAGVGNGIYAQTAQSGGNGLYVTNINTSGTAIYSAGQNAAGTYLVAGSGGSFNGVSTAIHAKSITSGVGQALYTDQFGSITRVNYYNGTTQYKILGIGTVSTTAENIDGERVTFHCTEAPEIYFEDYGQGQLVNGRAQITIDPTMAKNITVNDKHPLRVFIQLEDDCNGVFVTNKTRSSFDVVEFASGQSNAKFQYRIVGNRADEILPNGHISKNADTRFELAPKNLETKEAQTVFIDKPASPK